MKRNLDKTTCLKIKVVGMLQEKKKKTETSQNFKDLEAYRLRGFMVKDVQKPNNHILTSHTSMVRSGCYRSQQWSEQLG